MNNNGYTESQPGAGRSLMIFCLGMAVGACCALLYAPASGEEIRGQLVEKAGEFKDKAVEFKDKAMEQANAWKNKAAETVADTMDKTSQSVRRAGQTSEPFDSEVGVAA